MRDTAERLLKEWLARHGDAWLTMDMILGIVRDLGLDLGGRGTLGASQRIGWVLRWVESLNRMGGFMFAFIEEPPPGDYFLERHPGRPRRWRVVARATAPTVVATGQR
jgi:hypothetical protein